MEQPVKLSARVEASDGSYDPRLCSDIHDILPEPKCVQPPNYLASLDAAMSLVPVPYWMLRNEEGGPVATIMDETGSEFEVQAKTPALALCAAALKARGL